MKAYDIVAYTSALLNEVLNMKGTFFSVVGTDASFDGEDILKKAESYGLRVVKLTRCDSTEVWVRHSVISEGRKYGLDAPVYTYNARLALLNDGQLDYVDCIAKQDWAVCVARYTEQTDLYAIMVEYMATVDARAARVSTCEVEGL
jgi:hypothetical protein